ncbi:DNA polymerase III subunit delta' [Oleidesulfovibrio sp.]|uniref:DNA polymerase III subunit delta' n=1 Tax=Oleidesulfovibrio sp. TaxID=2909707 RepID=UPI003A839EC1
MSVQEDILSAPHTSEIVAPALSSRHDRVRGYLERLAGAVPQVLLLEGGTAREREALSLWWATRLNCPEESAPCLSCAVCAQFAARNNRDMFYLDGSEGSIKIDDVRAVRAVLGEPPRGRYRVVVLAEAQALGIEAANALLKSLEEPRPGTSFVLLAPQRERLLPTLVSRSWVLTLAWPDGDSAPAPIAEWADALHEFVQSGHGWFARTGTKSSLDHGTGLQLVAYLQRQLADALTGRASTSFSRMLASRLDDAALRKLDEALAECQDSLIYNVNPALVLDWLATRLYAWARTSRRA